MWHVVGVVAVIWVLIGSLFVTPIMIYKNRKELNEDYQIFGDACQTFSIIALGIFMPSVIFGPWLVPGLLKTKGVQQ